MRPKSNMLASSSMIYLVLGLYSSIGISPLFGQKGNRELDSKLSQLGRLSAKGCH